jgi:hypothetical protein
MFWGCTSLTTAPELPATTLANYCYEGMFHGCTSLTNVATVPDVVKPVSSNYCDGMYFMSSAPKSEDYSYSAWNGGSN